MRTQQDSEGTVLSYATKSQPDELVIKTHPSVRVILKGSTQGDETDWDLNDGDWHFLWIERESSTGHLTIREGARAIGPLTSPQTDRGRYLVVGQRQQFLKQFIEAKDEMDCIGLHTGSIFHLSDDTIDLHQSASIIASDACSGILLLSLLMWSIKTTYLNYLQKGVYFCGRFDLISNFPCHYGQSFTFFKQRRKRDR